MAKVDAVDACIVALERVVRGRFRCAHGPNLDRLVERGTSEHRRVLRVDLDLHDVMVMIDKRVNSGPVLIPIKHANCVIITARKHIWLRRVNSDVTNVVRVFLDRLDLLRRIVVEDSEHVVVATNHNHLLARDELGATDGRVGDLKGSDLRLCVVVVNHDSTAVKRDKHPWERRVQVHRLYAVGPIEEFLFDVKLHFQVKRLCCV